MLLLLLHVTGPLAVAASQNEDVEEPWSTYLHLWHAILQLGPPNPTPSSPTPHPKHNTTSRSTSRASGSKLGLQSLDTSPEQAAAEQQAVYDVLVRAVLDAVRNLDLEYHHAQGDAAADASKLSSADTKAALRQVCAARAN